VTRANFLNKHSTPRQLRRSNPLGQTHAREQNGWGVKEKEKRNKRRGRAAWRSSGSTAAKGNRRDSERHGVGWERRRDGEQGGQIPGLCAPDEFEFMWQCVSLRNVYVNPTHTQKNRQGRAHILKKKRKKDLCTPFNSVFQPQSLILSIKTQWRRKKRDVTHLETSESVNEKPTTTELAPNCRDRWI